MNSIDLMVDLETTGTSAGCKILSIGVCSFDETETFYSKISISSQPSLRDDYATIAWWDKQNIEAREEAFSGVLDLVKVLGNLADFITRLQKKYKNVYIWGNGADFDIPILGAAYEAVGIKKPWKPYNGRCYRTLKNLIENRGIPPDEFIGVKHNALNDARYQARHALKLLRKGNEIKTVIGITNLYP